MQKITTFLWFDDKAEEAMNFYCSVFRNSKIVSIDRYGKRPAGSPEGIPWPEGKVLTGVFELDGQQFMAIDGGPQFPFTEAISLLIECKDQADLDYYWEKLTGDGGEEGPCGWLKDKFGLSWQVVPEDYNRMIKDSKGTPAQKEAMMNALFQMKKLDIKALQDAYEKA
jgi:predicted 3-demethylubiquinone-9 3-methyltransferase (glyoxalase superfamily)